MCFSFGELNVADEVGIGYFLVFGDGVFGDKEDGIDPFNTFGGVIRFTSTLCQAKKSFVVEISQGAFLGTDQRVWREDLASVIVSITVLAVAKTRHG